MRRCCRQTLGPLLVLAGLAHAGEVTVKPAGGTPPADPLAKTGPRHVAHLRRYANWLTKKEFKPVFHRVTRRTYLDFLDRYVGKWHPWSPRPEQFKPATVGLYPAGRGMTTLARFKATGDAKCAAALKASWRAYTVALKEMLAKRGFIGDSEPFRQILDLALQAKVLRDAGQMTPADEVALREPLVLVARHLQVYGKWGRRYVRGGHHRGQGEGAVKALAARLCPDVPEGPTWRKYGELVWNDWWQFRDIPIADCAYLYASLHAILLRVELTGALHFYRDKGVRALMERLLYELTPYGAVSPYSCHAGWNSSAPQRIWMFELYAARTGDGRFRWAAERMWNYLARLGDRLAEGHWDFDQAVVQAAVYASLFVDDRIAPVKPKRGSMVLEHHRIASLADKTLGKKYLGRTLPMFSDPMLGSIACQQRVSLKHREPFLLVLRSGWDPDDMFMLVNLAGGPDPVGAAGGILGFAWQQATFTCTSWRGWAAYPACGVIVRGRGGRTPRAGQPNPDLREAYFPEVTVEALRDHKLAVYARVRVAHYMGFPMELVREFLFVKNRLVVTRDRLHPRDSFPAEVANIWNTQDIGPNAGVNWANTYMSCPLGYYLTYPNPAWDLVVWHAPRPDRRLRIVFRPEKDAVLVAPFSLRYTWQGIVRPDQVMLWTQVLWPCKAAGSLTYVTKPEDRGARIAAVVDQPDGSLLRVQGDKGRVTWLVVNPSGRPIGTDAFRTDAHYACVDVVNGKAADVLAAGATFLELAGKPVFRRAGRADFERAGAPATR